MADTYVVKRGDNLWQIANDHKVSFPELKKLNPQLAGRIPHYGINPGDVLKMPPSQAIGDIQQTCEKCDDCIRFRLTKPFLIAIAKDPQIVSRVKLTVNDDVLNGGTMLLGQDATHGTGREAPSNLSASTDEAKLKSIMRELLGQFAHKDPDKKAERLFDRFLEGNDGIEVFSDPDLDKAAAAHPNIVAFCDRTLAAPGTKGTNPKKIRIHQALQEVGWDIQNVKLIDDLGLPAFNEGSQGWRTGDYANGLGVMINGIPYIYVFVEAYEYDSCKQEYKIELNFAIYDVFGLDDEDLLEYKSYSLTTAGRGLIAWWQLQHQFNYAPLLTRAVVRRTYTISTAGQ